jgi:hypothetical protein
MSGMPGMVVYTYNLSTQEVQEKAWSVWGLWAIEWVPVENVGGRRMWVKW